MADISQLRGTRKSEKRTREESEHMVESDSEAMSRSSSSSQTENVSFASNPRRPATRSAPYLTSCLITDPYDPRCPYVTLSSQDALTRQESGHMPALTLCRRKADQSQLISQVHVKGSTFRHVSDSMVTFIGNDAEIKASSKSYRSRHDCASPEVDEVDRGFTNEHEVSPLPQRLANLWFEQERHAYLLSYQLVAILPLDEA